MSWPCRMFHKIRVDSAVESWGTHSWPVYRADDPADAAEYTFKTLPIGAMFVDDECDRERCKRPDGQCLVVKVPGRDGRGRMRGSLWAIDHPASDAGDDWRARGWTRTGTPPVVTVTPSIHFVGEYHGFLVLGTLSSDIEGRTYGGDEFCLK